MAQRDTVRVTEARRFEALPGDRTMGEFRELVEGAVRETFGSAEASYLWVKDLSDTWVVYEVEGPSMACTEYRVEFAMADDGTVTFAGDPVQVEERTTYETVTEAVRVESGRVLEAKGTDSAGGRVFAVQIIAAGTSKNGVRYPSSVLEAAAPLYEGAKAFDHHRTESELRTSTVAGLVGHYESVAANAAGITGDLHVLPSAAHIAEALDASIQAQDRGLPPVVGISHDVQASLTPAVEGGRRIQEATAITAVLSADVVADPSAGGRATRVVAGGLGSDPHPQSQEDTAMNLKQLLALLRQAQTDADRAALLEEHKAVVEGSGYTIDEVTALATVAESPEAPGGPAAGTGATEPPAAGEEGALAEPAEPVLVAESITGRMVIREAVSQAGLPESLVPTITDMVGARFTEAQLSTAVSGIRRVTEGLEREGLTPTVGHVQVTADELDKKREKVERTFEGNYQEGYHSLKEMYLDITGQRLGGLGFASPDLAHAIIRESHMTAPVEGRVTESVTSSTFGQILGDVMHKQLLAEYALPAFMWRSIVSSTPPLNDFRTRHITRMGGYGALPTVAEGGPYQPLTSPGDEEATYAPSKFGGTEDYTFEAAMNDDLSALVRIPKALGRAAARTLDRAVWAILTGNATIYDSVALFDAGHANTDSASLSQTNLSVGRRKMREQAAYGSSLDVLGTTPKYLVVPPELEALAFQLCTSPVAIPATPDGPSDTPNLHQGLTPIVLDFLTDASEWYLVADPSMIPTIEVGFLAGRQDPELFVQDSPTVGSSFNNDTVTWKIRHIYGLSVVDYRGFYRGT